jgi:hypothetical protein
MSRSEPLQWDNMSGDDQRLANFRVGEHTRGLVDKGNREAGMLRGRVQGDGTMKDKANIAKASRVEQAAGAVTRKTSSLNQAAQNRVDLIEKGTRELAMPGENIPGAGWYHDAGQKARDAAPHHDPVRAVAASSAMSLGTQPEVERRALTALASAEREGRVEYKGSMTEFGQVPARDIPGIVKNRPPSENVDYTSLGGPQSQTLGKAADILRGNRDEPQDPVKNPKTWSYSKALHEAANSVGTAEHGEYQNRMGVLGDKIAGRVGVGQRSFDLYGLQDSNEGLLSNRHHTAEDTWMQAASNRHLMPEGQSRRRLLKGLSDIPFGGKTDSRGEAVGGRGDTSISGEGVQHAWHNRATTMASEKLQDKYDTEFTIPSVGVQETSWTALRRESAQAQNKPGASADREYNSYLSRERSASKPPKPPTQKQQPRLF